MTDGNRVGGLLRLTGQFRFAVTGIGRGALRGKDKGSPERNNPGTRRSSRLFSTGTTQHYMLLFVVHRITSGCCGAASTATTGQFLVNPDLLE
jgi:hypothetical protein